MALTDTLYASVADLKSYLRIEDADDDTELGLAAEAASRAIDVSANRHFGLDDPAVERAYTYEGRKLGSRPQLYVDDISTTADLVVSNNGTAIASDDYQLYPTNASVDGKPWTSIVLLNGKRWTTEPQGIAVTAKYGWATVPDVVKQAALLQGSRFYKRRESPYGVAGSPDQGTELRLLAKLDPDVAVMLNTVTRWWGAA